MAEAGSKQAEPTTLDDNSLDKLMAESAKSPAEETTPENQIAEEKKDQAGKLEKQSDEQETKAKASGHGPSESKASSKKVQEGRAWNNRDRGRNDRGRGGRGGRGSRGGRADYHNPPNKYKHNIKSNMTMQEESSDPVAIRKQVEFYFSDTNLVRDKFLFDRVGGHSNLPVPISIIHSFQRMRHFQPLSAVVAALKDSTTLDVVDNDSCIKRKYPLPDDVVGKSMPEVEKVYEDKAMARSVYAKGFGQEEPGTQFDVEAFFSEFGTTNSVRLRRTYEKIFKGSVFVEFDSEETQTNFLALEPKPKWKGKELLIKSKKQYCDEKVEEIAAGRIKPNDKSFPGDRYGNKRNSTDDRDWKTRRKEDQENGFPDRNDRNDRRGNRKGFGSSGQRGRGDYDRRGGGSGKDRNEERNRTEHNEHEVKAPTIQATSSPTISSPKATETDTPSASETLYSKINTVEADEIKPDVTPTEVMNDESLPPTEPSKKRPRDEDEEDAAFEGNHTKAQKMANPTTSVTASAPKPTGDVSKKRQRDDDNGAELEATRAKVQKVAEDDNGVHESET